MTSNPPTPQQTRVSISNKTKVITVGIVLVIIGSLISSSYAKETITNYTGFGMLLVGIAIAVFGVCATSCATLSNRLCQQINPNTKFKKPKLLFAGVWIIGVGIVLTVIGSILAAQYEKNSFLNYSGFEMLLSGICVFVLGICGTALATLTTGVPRTAAGPLGTSMLKIEKSKALFSSIMCMGIGLVLVVVGCIIADSYARETDMNFIGFGMMLSGVFVLGLGTIGTIVTFLRNRWHLTQRGLNEYEPRVMLGSIWAMGIGSMLIITGSLIASSYAKNSLMNYAGFGMLLMGTGVFVYGIFETARFSAMGYMTSKRTGHPKVAYKQQFRKRTSFSNRAKSDAREMIKSRAVLNIAGIMIAMGLLFFSLWQLDMIVSGPVWYSNSNGSGWSWNGPGPYADDYFQCFIWKTTVGQAYDTLFMMIFISFIVLFLSAFFWPKHNRYEDKDDGIVTSSSPPIPPPPDEQNIIKPT
jgi:hypothetical protein